MHDLPTRDDLLRRKATQGGESTRSRQRADSEKRGLEEACALYWQLLAEFVARANELELAPQIYESVSRQGSAPRVAWVEGYRLKGGSIVTAPPLRYCMTERRLVMRPRRHVQAVTELSLFVSSTDASLGVGLSEPKTASEGGWPPVTRLDRTANVLNALSGELEASLLDLMGPDEASSG